MHLWMVVQGDVLTLPGPDDQVSQEERASQGPDDKYPHGDIQSLCDRYVGDRGPVPLSRAARAVCGVTGTAPSVLWKNSLKLVTWPPNLECSAEVQADILACQLVNLSQQLLQVLLD